MTIAKITTMAKMFGPIILSRDANLTNKCQAPRGALTCMHNLFIYLNIYYEFMFWWAKFIDVGSY